MEKINEKTVAMVSMPMILEIENLIDGINNVRLFRNQKIENALVSVVFSASNFDDNEIIFGKKKNDIRSIIEFSQVIDFVKLNICRLGMIGVEMGGTQILINTVDLSDNKNKQTIFACYNSLFGRAVTYPIHLNSKLVGEIVHDFFANTDLKLTQELQLGIPFIKKGKIRLYLYPAEIMCPFLLPLGIKHSKEFPDGD